MDEQHELIAQFQDNIKSKSMKNIHLIQIKSVIITLIPGIILNKYIYILYINLSPPSNLLCTIYSIKQNIKYNFQHHHDEEFIYILYFHHC